MPNPGQDMQLEIYGGAMTGSPSLPCAFEEWEDRARAALADEPWWYVAGGAGGGDTMRSNRAAFLRWEIRPRVARDISERDLGITLFGSKTPRAISSRADWRSGNSPRGWRACDGARCGATGVPFILSNVSSFTIEQVAEAAGDGARWFQLYPGKNRDVMRSALTRAEASGYSAVVATLDTPMLGWRERDLKTGYLPFLQGQGVANYLSDPVFRALLPKTPEEDPRSAIMLMLSQFTNPKFTWADVDWLREATKLPLLLKGVLDADDAAIAVDHGVDGIIVSNHGGRQVDGSIASLDALPEVCETVEGRVPVLLDSGVRRGPDVLKAIALGASAVLVGRPFAYALASEGEAGVRHVIRTLIADIDLTLALSGRTSIDEVTRTLLERD